MGEVVPFKRPACRTLPVTAKAREMSRTTRDQMHRAVVHVAACTLAGLFLSLSLMAAVLALIHRL